MKELKEMWKSLEKEIYTKEKSTMSFPVRDGESINVSVLADIDGSKASRKIEIAWQKEDLDLETVTVDYPDRTGVRNALKYVLNCATDPGKGFRYSDERLESLWDEFGGVPTDEDPEGRVILNEAWNRFPKGTSVEEIWHWFDEHYSRGVAWLMYEYQKTKDKFVRLVKASNDLYDLGLPYDEVYRIENERGIQVGLLFLTLQDFNTVYIEWLELMTPFRGKGYLKMILRELSVITGKSIDLECSEENLRKYLNSGCVEHGVDDCTELYRVSYPSRFSYMVSSSIQESGKDRVARE